MRYLAYALVVVGGLAIGAMLVMNEHPFFGFLAMAIAACVEFKGSSE